MRIFNYGENLALFVSTPDASSPYYGINQVVGKRYFTKLHDLPTPRIDLFLKEKPANGYRIFVLGESTAAGFPYGNNVTFSRILNYRLSDVFPDKHIEIVNTALAAINTYTQLDFMDEILQNKPDAILIYSGHNEFYGALGVGSIESFGKNRWIVKTALALQKLKIYLLMRDLITGIERLLQGNRAVDDNDNPSATIMERIVENKSIPFKSEEYELGKTQFEENLSEIIKKAQNAGVKVLISDLVSNIGTNEPFKSIENADCPSAQKVYEIAVGYEKEGKYDEARNAFYRAKDLDALRFRAPEEFNEIIHAVAEKFKIPIVPMKSFFESQSPHRIIGDELMLEHLHPTLNGYFLMADAFFETMRKEKFISPVWREKNIKPLAFYRNNWGFTALDSTYASLRILQLKSGWPFKKGNEFNAVFSQFRLSNKVDSIAATILVTREFTLEQGHIELASYYESGKDLKRAFNEYNALIYTVPYFDLFYEPAVKVLVEMNNYDKALEILYRLLEYQQTPLTYKWIGQIYLIKNETPKGIAYLEKVRESGPSSATLLYNLGCAYYKISRFQKGNEILDELNHSSADPSLVNMLKAKKLVSMDHYTRAVEYNQKAQNLFNLKDYDRAYTYVQRSLKIQETSGAYELMGMLDLARGEKAEALTCLEKANQMSDASSPQLLYRLSVAYYINEEYDKARTLFEGLSTAYPNFPDPNDLNTKLQKTDKHLMN